MRCGMVIGLMTGIQTQSMLQNMEYVYGITNETTTYLYMEKCLWSDKYHRQRDRHTAFK